ncbi:MAG: glycosyltransferase family 4 protein [Nitrospirota bacterium]|nr:glycosyltransferase family 4 protein [Nitrospirota bacterium]
MPAHYMVWREVVPCGAACGGRYSVLCLCPARWIRFALIGRMAWRLRRDGVQVVHTHHVGQLLCGGLAAKLAGAKLVHTEHDSHSLMKPRTQRLFRVLSQFADRITTVSDSVTQFLRDQIGIPDAKLQMIPNGVLVEAFQDAPRLASEPFGWNDRDGDRTSGVGRRCSGIGTSARLFSVG